MSLKFLCPVHREQFQSRPVLARAYWDNWMEAGTEAFHNRDWQDALRYLGCCFELSDIMLSEQKPISVEDALNNFDRYMVAGLYLAECFGCQGDKKLERHCLLSVHHRLSRELEKHQQYSGLRSRNLEISLHMLKRHYEAHQEFSDISHSYQQAKDLLRNYREQSVQH